MHITMENARTAIEAARKKAIEHETQMCIAVVDSGANLKAFLRMDDAWVGPGRWVFVYWARKLIRIVPEDRALLFLGAAYATIRLQKLVLPTPARIPKGVALTARELSVLRALSLGERPRQIAKQLGLGEETVRSHIKKAQLKLGVPTPGAAIATSIRLHLIP